MAFSTDAVSNWFLARADRDNVGLTPMKLQKLIYYAHGWHLANHPDGQPLVDEEPQAWEFGPVFPTVYHEFKRHGNHSIDTRAVEVDVKGGQISFFEPSISSESAKEDGSDKAIAEEVLEQVWKVYGNASAGQLSNLTHREGTPWHQVRTEAEKTYRGYVPLGLNIPNELIRQWFKSKLATLN